MKTVSGKVLSCKPVSISKASKVLSNFVSTDNGASPAFAAYLRRASASFNELAQLHKEQKRSGSQHKVKKQHSHGTVTEVTDGSVINRSQDGLLAEKEARGVNKIEREVRKFEVDENEEKHNAGRSTKKMDGRDGLLAKEISTSKRKEVRGVNMIEREVGRIEVDENEGKYNALKSTMTMEVQETEGIVDGNVEIVRGAGKKSKIKKENSERLCSDHDAVNESELKSRETKKKKRDIKKEVLKDDGDVQAIEADKSYSDKQKKHKKDQHHGDHAAAISIKVKNEIESFDGSKDTKKKKKIRDKPEKEKSDDLVDMEKEKKHKKKRTHEERDIEYEGKLEIKAANNKESRKRKHESVVDEGLENSQEKHKSKKKKR